MNPTPGHARRCCLHRCIFIARDAHAVYHTWTHLPAIDRDSFCQCGDYWLDKRNVHFEYETLLKALAEADCATFRSMGGGYGADDHGGWYCGRRMKHCLRGDLLQTIPHDPLYAVDESSVYCDGKPLPGVDRARWQLLDGHFSGDGSRICYLEQKLPRVDVASWRMLQGSWSRDHKHLFDMFMIENDPTLRAQHGFRGDEG